MEGKSELCRSGKSKPWFLDRSLLRLMIYIYKSCTTLRTLHSGKYGIFLIMGNAGVISSTVLTTMCQNLDKQAGLPLPTFRTSSRSFCKSRSCDRWEAVRKDLSAVLRTWHGRCTSTKLHALVVYYPACRRPDVDSISGFLMFPRHLSSSS